MIKTINIDGKEYTFSNSVWTLKIYKDNFGSDWHSDRNAQLVKCIKAIKFQQEYSGLTDEQFSELPHEKQDTYWKGLDENFVNLDFTLNTIYAMAIMGGFKGTFKEFWSEIPSSEMKESSELMQLAEQFMSDFAPQIEGDAKKKVKQ